jgi:hypothetical protein
MPDSRRPGLGTTFLVGGVLLLLVLIGLAVFLPILSCSECWGLGSRSLTLFTNRMGETDTRPGAPCEQCSGLGKISCFKKWTHLRNAPAQ